MGSRTGYVSCYAVCAAMAGVVAAALLANHDDRASRSDGGTHESPRSSATSPGPDPVDDASPVENGSAPAESTELSWAEARAIARKWSDAGRSGDEHRERAALAQLLRALRDEQGHLVLEALRALFAFRGVEFEREPFREAVRPWLESENYQIRQSAVWALSTLSPSSADLPALAARARDPKRSVRAEVLPALANTAGAFEDPAVLAIATGLLREAIPENKYRMLRPLRRFDLPPELQLAVIEVRQSGGIARKIAHRTLVYLPTKSEATVLFLVDGIGEFRSNRHTFALQGLQHGVPRHLHSLVAANLVNALHRWPVGTTPHWSLQGLGEIGTEAHLETIREWGRARPNTAYEREAREAVAKIEARLAAVEE